MAFIQYTKRLAELIIEKYEQRLADRGYTKYNVTGNKKYGISRINFKEHLNIRGSHSTMNRIKKGSSVKREKLEAIAEDLGVRVDKSKYPLDLIVQEAKAQ